MKITFRALSDEEIAAIGRWRYDPPYDVYNDSGENPNHMRDKEYGYRAAVDQDGAFLGFVGAGADSRVRGYEYSDDAVDIGMGIAPDAMGRGLGPKVARAFIEHIESEHGPVTMRATIAEFNERSIHVAETLGFERVDRFESQDQRMPFVVLVRAPVAS